MCIRDSVITEGEVEKMKAGWRAHLDAEFEAAIGYKPNKADWLDGRWSGLKAARGVEDPRRGNTGVDGLEQARLGVRLGGCLLYTSRCV